MTDESESLSEAVQKLKDDSNEQQVVNEGRVSTQIDIDDITGNSQSALEFM